MCRLAYIQPLRQGTSFNADEWEWQTQTDEKCRKRLGSAGDFYLANNPARGIEDAHAAEFH
ncbi:hypothetical protein MAE02_64420 [Microvirga aerophila]|uniref:Uncharacterized protein n=1 Tax=Microvirga aerophila TaxID=670291 RepID=A0A512C3G5_9HYPH|nr:hypothetical protein MAE02_64420 [Microvirga aerophila]